MFFTSCKILQYKKNDVSEETDVNKTNALKECMLYRYWYFKDVRFKVEPHVCYKCHDILITAYEFKNVVILNVETFILVLIENGTKSHGKNLISWNMLIRSIIAQVITMLVLINMVISVEHR